MRKFLSGSLASMAVLVLAACDAGVPTQVSENQAAPLSASNGANVVASASAGAQYTLVCCGGLVIEQSLNLTAQKDTDGNVKGELKYTQAFDGFDGRWKAHVTCMNVYEGNRVKVGGIITQSTDPDPDFGVGRYIWVHLIDNGQGSAAAPDQASGGGFGDNAENEAFCDSPALPNPRFLSNVSSGNIKVTG